MGGGGPEVPPTVEGDGSREGAKTRSWKSILGGGLPTVTGSGGILSGVMRSRILRLRPRATARIAPTPRMAPQPAPSRLRAFA